MQEIAEGFVCGRTEREKMADVKRIGGTKGILENSRFFLCITGMSPVCGESSQEA